MKDLEFNGRKATWPMQWNIQIGLSAVFGTLLMLSMLSFLHLRHAAESERWVRHSHRVMSHLANFSWAIDRVRATGRAYALNHSEEHLQDAISVRQVADTERRTLLELTADNHSQLRRLDAVRGLARPVTLEQMKTVGNGSLKIEFEAYRKVPYAMAQEESSLLREREAAMTRIFDRASTTVAVALLLGFVFYVLTVHTLRRSNAIVRMARAEDDERMRVLVDGVVDYAMIRLGPGGRIKSWNAGARRIAGYEAGEIVGRNVSCFYAQADIDSGVPQGDLHKAASGGRAEVERWRLRKDGSRFFAGLVITAARDVDGTLIGFSEISQDLSARSAADAMYRGLLETAPDAIVVVDQCGEIALLNAQAEKQFGYRRDELIGQKVTDIIPTGFAQTQPKGTVIELVARRKDHSEFPIGVMLSTFESSVGTLVTAMIRGSIAGYETLPRKVADV